MYFEYMLIKWRPKITIIEKEYFKCNFHGNKLFTPTVATNKLFLDSKTFGSALSSFMNFTCDYVQHSDNSIIRKLGYDSMLVTAGVKWYKSQPSIIGHLCSTQKFICFVSNSSQIRWILEYKIKWARYLL